MKSLNFVFLIFVLVFISLYKVLPQSSSMQKHRPTSPAHRDFIKVSTDSLFAFLDIMNYFTNRKFSSYFDNLKKAWEARKFDEFDKLCENLGSNQELLKFMRDRKNDGKDHYLIKLPSDGRRIIFNKQYQPNVGDKQPPETEDIIFTCDCPSPCVVCFCPGSCASLSLCLCFYDSSPNGIPGGGAGGYFCNMFRGGKPCALRPPDFSP